VGARARYRHIDTAQAYGNEASVGRALRDSGVPRDEVFITTKFYPNRKDPEAEVQRSLERLGVDQVDLYIIHWPGGGPRWAWPGMERARERGFARSIGVSNFSLAELDQLLSDVKTPPVINQVQFSPFAFRRRLLQACEERSVALEAYSPLGTGRHPRPARPPGRRARRAHAGAGSSCAGACSATWSSCPSPPTASGSSRTRASSTSRCPPRTWPRSTPSTRPVAPTTPSSTTGGDDASHAWHPGPSAHSLVATQGSVMAEEFEGRDLSDSVFWGVDLRRATFRDVNLSGVSISHALLDGVDIDAKIDRLVINGVDVTDYVNERDRWYPLRAMVRPADPEGARAAWAALEQTWAATIGRADRLTDGQRHERVDGEWSFVETLRHLLFAMDKWFTAPILGEGFHPIGMPNSGSVDFPWPDLDRDAAPSYDEVLAARAQRADRFRAWLDELEAADLTREVGYSRTAP
jgi:hypothetical protein